MPAPGNGEPRPSSEPLAYQGLYAAMLETAEGDVGQAIDAISTPEAAVVLALGYMDQLSAGEGIEPTEVHRHVAARVYGRLLESSQGDPAVLRGQQALWDPVLGAVKVHQELGSQWEKVRAAVHFFDLVAASYDAAPAVPGGGGSSSQSGLLSAEQEYFSGLDVYGAVHFFEAADGTILRGDL